MYYLSSTGNEHQQKWNFLCEYNLLEIIGYCKMCGDALTGYKALSSSRDCSGESMFCFSCCVYKIYHPFTDSYCS